MTKKVTIPVSRTNLNRFRCQTHTIRKILQLEGGLIIKGTKGAEDCVVNPITNQSVPLSMIELVPKKRQALIVVE